MTKQKKRLNYRVSSSLLIGSLVGSIGVAGCKEPQRPTSNPAPIKTKTNAKANPPVNKPLETGASKTLDKGEILDAPKVNTRPIKTPKKVNIAPVKPAPKPKIQINTNSGPVKKDMPLKVKKKE